MIDITMTAVCRPEVIEKTLRSFMENLFNHGKDLDLRLIVNVDPVGEIHRLIDTLTFIHSIGPRRKVVNTPLDPNFPKAFKWTWSKVEGEWVFHLEDDWELLRPVDLKEMIRIMNEDKNLAILRLPMFKAGEKDMKNWNKFFPWNGRFYECPKDIRHRVGFAGHPSLIKRAWFDRVFPLIDDVKNPEKQFQYAKEGNQKLYKELNMWDYGVWAKPGDPPVIKDLGREWVSKTNWHKREPKAFFTRWEMTP